MFETLGKLDCIQCCTLCVPITIHEMVTVSSVHLVSTAEALVPKIALHETEESWETIFNALGSLRNLFQNGASEYASDLVPIIRSLSHSITNSMTSERTRLSGAAIELINAAVVVLGTSFEPFLSTFLPVLLSLCGRTNKVIITRAKVCIKNIIESTQLPSILPYFVRHIRDKSMSIRLAAAEGTLSCMNCFNPLEFEKDARAQDVETVIRATVKDSQPEIRVVSRQVYAAFKILLPSRVQGFNAPLSPTMRKYLGIKVSNSPRRLPVHHSVSGGPVGRSQSIVSSSENATRSRTESRPNTTANILGRRMAASTKFKVGRAIEPSVTRNRPLAVHTVNDPASFPPSQQPEGQIVARRPPARRLQTKHLSATRAQRLEAVKTRGSPSPTSTVMPDPPQHFRRSIENRPGDISQKSQSGPRRIPVLESQLGQLGIVGMSTTGVSRTDASRSISRNLFGRGRGTNTSLVDNPDPPKLPNKPHTTSKFGIGRGVTRSTFSSRSRTQSTVRPKAPNVGPTEWLAPTLTSASKGGIEHKAPIPHEVGTQINSNLPSPPLSPLQAISNLDKGHSERPASKPHSPTTSILASLIVPADDTALSGRTVKIKEHPSMTDLGGTDLLARPFSGDSLLLTGETKRLSVCAEEADDQTVAGTTPYCNQAVADKHRQPLMSSTTPQTSFLSCPPNSSENTPITSLLSSIQKGFLFTPVES